MGRIVVLCFAALVSLPVAAKATPTIHVGYHPLNPAGLNAIDVFVSGGDPIGAIDMLISIGNSDWVHDPGEPRIVSVDVVTGTIFEGNSAHAAPGQVYADFDDFWQIDNITASGTVPASGKIFTVVIDSTGVPNGSIWSLNFFTDFWGASNYSNDTVLGEPFLGSNGGIYSVGPEPGSLVLGMPALVGLGAVAVHRRRHRHSP